MPAETTLEQLPAFVSFADVEHLASRLGGMDSLTLDVSRFRRAKLFAEAGLLSLMTLARRQGKEVCVQLGGPLPPFQAGTTNRYWKIFCESISGFILGQLSDTVHDGTGTDVTTAIRSCQSELLKGNEGYIGSGKEVAAAIVDRFGAPRSAQVMREANASSFGHLLAYALALRLGIQGEPGGAMLNLSMFASELLENTREHAMTDLDELPIEGLRFLNVRRLNPSEPNIEELQVGDGGYQGALREVLAVAQRAEHLVEITVADCGPGIAARMAHSFDVYDGPIATERRFVLDAIAKGGSSKPASVTGKGLGLQNVLDAARALRGLVVFRTGRTCLHYSDVSGSGGRGVDGVDDPPYPFMPGTSVSLLFPWKVRGQQLNLFGGTNANADCGG